MEYEQWLGILTSINADNNLNESNVIEKIKEKLEKEDPGTYKEWQDNQFGVNYTLLDSQLTLLHIATANGLAKVTELLIKKGAEVDKANQYGCTPLHYAAAEGHTEVVNALIVKGADVNAVNQNGSTPLHFAAVKDHIEIVNALIEKGANVNAVGENKWTPLYLAVENGHIKTVKALVENGADVNAMREDKCTLLRFAAQIGHTEMVKALIGKGADVNAVNQNGSAPLHFAAAEGHTEMVNALIGNGADVNAVGEDNCTPLHLAVENGHIKTINALIGNGADINAVNQNGWTPLHFAAQMGHTEIVNTLIENGADVNVVGEDNCTPLHLAIENGHTEIEKVLIENGAIVDEHTLLRFAAKNGYTEMVNTLIGKGVNVNAVDIMGYTSLHFAAKNGHIEIVNALIENGANVEAVVIDGHRYTPLHFAAQMGHTEIVNTLIKNGANVNVLSESDKVTPLYLAVQSGHAEAVKALMKKGADPLLENKSYRTLKRLTELIKNNSLGHLPKKAEETTTGEQVDDEYELLKYSLLFRNGCPLIDTVGRDTFDNLICTWFAGVSGLTPKQKELNKKLLSILKDLPYLSDEDILLNFLLENNSDDLKDILNLTRGESGLTILHVISSMDGKLVEKCVDLLLEAGADPNIKDDRGKTPLHYASYNNIGSLIKAGTDPNVKDNEERTPLHYAASIGDEKSINALLEHGADSSKKDKQEKTPLQVATDNHNYHVERYFLTDNQKRLCQEFGRIADASDFFTDFTELKGFLSKYKNTQDLKRILNLRDREGKSEILLNLRIIFYSRHFRDCETPYEEAKRLLLEAGAIDYKRLDGKEHSPKSETLWDNLILDQQQKLKMFLDVVGKAQDMNQLEQIVNRAIESGVRFNFLICPGEMMYQDTYNFTDYVIKRISELKKNPKVASDIICKLVSKGAELHNLSSIDVIDTLESEFKDHKTNMKKAREEYVNNTLEFMEIVKSAATGRIKNAKMDNSTFYLEYSEDSTINVAKITDGARDLGLVQGEIEYGRDIIRIGKSEVEIITKNGIRNYTDLADNSDIALTFHTSEGELEVRLYPDTRNKDLIRVEVNNQGLLKQLKDCKEEIGKNCLLGGLSVNEAIEQGFFDRSGKLRQPSETMSSSVQQSHGYELKAAQPIKQQLLQDLCNVESNVMKKEKDFDTKTHLIDIFKILHKLLRDKEDVSKTDLANVAEKESKRLGLEGRYNWNGIFGLEKAVSQNIEQEGSSLPLSNDLYRQDKLASSVSNKVEKCTTKGDGNCFFHAVFGGSSSGVYKTDRAQEMRQEWHKFLSQFESLDDPKMPKALRERLSSVFHNVFPMQESDFCTSNLYKEYLSKVNEQSYFIYLEEVSILASLASTEIELYYTQGSSCKIKPNPGMINADYKTNQELWGSKVQEAIYLEGNHYSRAEVTVQPQKDFPPYSESPRCGITEPRVESYQQGLFVK
ncbi:ankyrin repeat domain-containing protein [Wolbachia endosymbiont (group B) of Ennomos erosarius]|uniref:ankyrin repeat domain-containing protein n=1 Tax=Wolbachia endosymbiont (group B) of Ennomos erosarius TaxID=3066175 RepID=UPI00313338D7